MQTLLKKSMLVGAFLMAASSFAVAAVPATNLGPISNVAVIQKQTTDGPFLDFYNFSISLNGGVISSVFSVTTPSGDTGPTNLALYAGAFSDSAGLPAALAVSGPASADVVAGTTLYTVTVSTGPLSLANIYTLTVGGNSQGNGAYAGLVNVSPVPEPETYAMLLAGIGMMGAIAQRRRLRR